MPKKGLKNGNIPPFVLYFNYIWKQIDQSGIVISKECQNDENFCPDATWPVYGLKR